MDNQQPKANELDLAWLAGFIDGEGCFDFPRHHTKGLKCERWSPRVRVCNTHKPTLLDVVAVLRAACTGHWVNWRVPKNSHLKPSWDVSVVGIKRIERFLPLLIPHLRTKKHQAMTMLEWVKLRLQQRQIDPYTPELEALREHVKRLRD